MEPTPEIEDQSATPARQKWALLAAAGLVAAASIIIAIAWKSPPEAREPKGEPVQQASHRSVGSEARLYLRGRDSIMVAADEKTLDDLIDSLAARDGGAASFIQSGRVFTVANDTKARILAISSGRLKVQVLEGDHAMKEGWVVERWIR